MRLRRAPAPLRRCALIGAVALALAGCSASPEDRFASAYGPARSNPLPDTPGRGLWNPPALRPVGLGSQSLIPRIPGPDFTPATGLASEAPPLPTEAQQAAQRQALEGTRDGHVRAMDARLRRDRR